MGWRDKYKVHPAADVFPMMSDEELQKLGEDIKKNGQTIPVLFWNGDGKGRILIDGRNRLEAMERVGIDPDDVLMETFICKDPITHIITLNIHRRHLTKQQQADLIVAAHAAAPVVSRQDGGKLPEGRPVDQTKASAVATAAEHGISRRTVERAIAKAEGKTPEPKLKPKPKSTRTGSGAGILPEGSINHARWYYLSLCADPPVDLDEEMRLVMQGLREIAGKRAIASQKQAATLPQDKRSENGRGDPTHQNSQALLAKLEAELKRGTKKK
jgi:ParB-like chromosome segregation protein Spo0J